MQRRWKAQQSSAAAAAERGRRAPGDTSDTQTVARVEQARTASAGRETERGSIHAEQQPPRRRSQGSSQLELRRAQEGRRTRALIRPSATIGLELSEWLSTVRSCACVVWPAGNCPCLLVRPLLVPRWLGFEASRCMQLCPLALSSAPPHACHQDGERKQRWKQQAQTRKQTRQQRCSEGGTHDSSQP